MNEDGTTMSISKIRSSAKVLVIYLTLRRTDAGHMNVMAPSAELRVFRTDTVQ